MRYFKASYSAGLLFLAALIGFSILECLQGQGWRSVLFAALSLAGFCLLVILDRAARDKFHGEESILDAVPLPLSVTDRQLR